MSKEMDKIREHQRVKAEEELKAKLSLVEMRERGSFGSRMPKRIGEIVVDTGIKTGYHTQTIAFPLRITHAGEFIAECADVCYISESREALKAKMEQVGRITLDLKWIRYIRVEYTAEVESSKSWSWRSLDSLDIEEARKGRSIYGLKMEYEIVEFSEPFTLPGDDESERYMKRSVDTDGDPDEKQETVTKLPDGLMPHTPAREAVLKSIVEAFTEIDRKMLTLLRGDSDAVAKAIDAVAGPFLLASGEAPKSRKGSKS